MSASELPSPLAENATPAEAEAWLRQLARWALYGLNAEANLTDWVAYDFWTRTKDPAETEKLQSLEPSRKCALAILHEAGRDPDRIWQEERDRADGMSEDKCE